MLLLYIIGTHVVTTYTLAFYLHAFTYNVYTRTRFSAQTVQGEPWFLHVAEHEENRRIAVIRSVCTHSL